MRDIFLIDKPAGITSFDVIRILRRKFRERNPSAPLPKMGHAGTLDPLATGLMIIGVGDGTKKLQEYLKLPKVYEAEVMLGMRTDTGDREGEILDRLEGEKVKRLKTGDVERILNGLVGKLTLPVPMYSAIKVGGRPLYRKARAGEKFEPPKKEMEVMRLAFRGIRNKEQVTSDNKTGVIVEFEAAVASGTYIRSLAEEIGRRLGVPAMLWSLRRTRIGKFRVEEAEKL